METAKAKTTRRFVYRGGEKDFMCSFNVVVQCSSQPAVKKERSKDAIKERKKKVVQV